MRRQLSSEGQLTVEYKGTVFRKLMVGLGAVLFAAGIYELTAGRRDTDRLISLVGSAGLCLAIGLVLLEESHFAFDSRERTVSWRRRWVWRRDGGRLSFDDVAGVIVQMHDEGQTLASSRISLQLADGRLLPLTRVYRPDPSGERRKTAEQIRELLGTPAATSEQVLAALVRGGHTLDAIRLLRAEGLSLTDAKRRLDRYTAP